MPRWIETTPVTPDTHRYVAQRVIAFCAAYVDANFDPNAKPPINTDELIEDACHQFGISGAAGIEVYEMREGYSELNPTAANLRSGR